MVVFSKFFGCPCSSLCHWLAVQLSRRQSCSNPWLSDCHSRDLPEQEAQILLSISLFSFLLGLWKSCQIAKSPKHQVNQLLVVMHGIWEYTCIYMYILHVCISVGLLSQLAEAGVGFVWGNVFLNKIITTEIVGLGSGYPVWDNWIIKTQTPLNYLMSGTKEL